MLIKRIAASTVAVVVLGAAGAGHAASATLVGSYFFNDNLNSSTAGAPALVPTEDPSVPNVFTSATINSVTRPVYDVNGVNSPVTDQGGLTFDGAGFINQTDGYSVALTFEFQPTGSTPGDSADRDGNEYRRILDTSDRQSDNGFYDAPGDQLQVYPLAGSNAAFVAGVFRNVVLTVGPGAPGDPVDVHAYIDGGSALSVNTNVVDLGPNDDINLFLDNVINGGQGEWAPTRIATAEFFDGVLTADQAAAFTGNVIAPPPPGAVPEPATWAMMLFGVFGAGAVLRGSRRLRAVEAV